MDFPAHPNQLTAQWLTDVLRSSGQVLRASIVSCDLESLSAEKGLTGDLVRLRLTYDLVEANTPASVVAKFSGVDPESRAIIHSMGFYEREVRFYQEFSATSPIRTPHCYFR